MWCLCAPLEDTQETDGLSRAKRGRAGPKDCNFRSISVGGKLLPDLAWNNVLSLCLFVTVLPPGKSLSEPLNFRERGSVWFSCSCSKGFAVGPGSCVPTLCPPAPPRASLGPVGVGFAPCCPWGGGWGSGGSVGSPSQSIQRLYSLM